MKIEKTIHNSDGTISRETVHLLGWDGQGKEITTGDIKLQGPQVFYNIVKFTPAGLDTYKGLSEIIFQSAIESDKAKLGL